MSSILEVPGDLQAAYSHACLIIGWQENLQRDEMPPDYIWPFSDELDEWFTEIDFKRDNPDSNDSSSMGDLDENQFEFD